MFDRMLVPLDGSTFAEAALPLALTLARRGGGCVRLVAVHEAVPAFAYGDRDEAARTWARDYLEQLREKLVATTEQDISTAVREGGVVDEIRHEAEAWPADVVVMATHGRGAVSRVWLGSVADGCVRRVNRPVLLVRPPQGSDAPDFTASDVSRVVVPLDGSPLAEGALDGAARLSELFEAPLSLIRAVAYPIGPMSPYLPHTIEMSRQVVDDARDAAERYLGEVAERMRARGLEVDATVVTDQHAAHAILEHAGDDPVAMATHGRSGMERALLGSVADKVIRGAGGPVLALRPR
ncbi:MAG: universal stress protein [Gemmatimonadetes bacterium]|nr:universal stress protein [Gemmatimonadota bacterium]